MVIEAKDFRADILTNYDIVENKEKRKANKIKYLNCICAFDIETTRLKDIEQSILYIWQLQIDNLTVVGRYWEEYFKVLEDIRELIEDKYYLVIYVHNLDYEFQFLKGLYDFEPDEVFCLEPRKILKCTMFNCIEYRCSYKVSNMSLDKLLKKYNVENKKLTYDYEKIRYSWTSLSADELAYCINDVKGLVQALKKQLASDNDTLATIPLTATGYVRRDVREAMASYNHKQLKDMLPSAKVYSALVEAFRGGDTSSNRWNTDEILDNVKSADEVSAYILAMLCRPLPMSRFILEKPSNFNRLYKDKSKALLFKVIFIGLKLKTNTEGHAYLSRDKCRDIEGGTFCNGRILNADYLETTITNIDMWIIEKRYSWQDMKVFKLWSANMRLLPLEFRKVISNYYKVKTELKGVDEGTDDYIFYMKNKEKLNACYGMTVEKIKDEIEFINGEYIYKDEDLASLVSKHNKRAFLNYAWGVYITAWSRYALSCGIDVVTKEGTDPFNAIYWDTDSVKYIGDVDFTDYNNEIEKLAKKHGAYATDRNGVVHFIGVFEDEGYLLPNRFKTLGAKKYVLEDSNKKLHITIAGVNKKLGGDELEKLENFKEGFIFNKAGGNEIIYNDNVDMYYLTIEGKQVHITDNAVIRPSTYTLGITAEYQAILDGLVDIKYSDHDIAGLYKVKR